MFLKFTCHYTEIKYLFIEVHNLIRDLYVFTRIRLRVKTTSVGPQFLTIFIFIYVYSLILLLTQLHHHRRSAIVTSLLLSN
jgi:hypothetical protein